MEELESSLHPDLATFSLMKAHKNKIAYSHQAGKMGAKPIVGSPLLKRREDD